jgi:hypothetical protein
MGINSYQPIFNPYEGSDLFMFKSRDELSDLSKDTKRIFEYLLSKDSMSIIRYAAGFSPELTGFGAIGLYIWHKENNYLNKKARALLK